MAYDLNEVINAYNEITKKLKYDLDVEFAGKRIRGTEYADTYKALMDSAMKMAWQTPTLSKDDEIKDKQLENLIKEGLLLDAQIDEIEARTAKIISDKQIAEQHSLRDLEIKQKQSEKLTCDISYCAKTVEKLTQDIEQAAEKHVKELELADAEIDLKDKQVTFTDRQTQGFDENIQQKMLEIQMNSWAMMFSSGMLTDKPTIITNDEVSDLYCHMKQNAGVGPC